MVMCRGCDVPADLIDISLGGMSVHYIPVGLSLPDSTVCDLIAPGQESVLPRALACRAVYDIAELSEDRSFKGSEMRRRGFRFLSLEEEQKHEVEVLIRLSRA